VESRKTVLIFSLKGPSTVDRTGNQKNKKGCEKIADEVCGGILKEIMRFHDRHRNENYVQRNRMWP
jgi:hypothetical protein